MLTLTCGADTQQTFAGLEDVLKTGQARNQEFFRAGEFSRNQGTSIKISSTTHERKAPQGKNMGFFSPGNS